MSEAQTSEARTAGRGGLSVLVAKVFFIVSGFAQQALLPRLIGMDGYGALSRVLAVSNIVNNVTVSTAIQSMSRAVAKSKDEKTALRTGLLVHLPLALFLGGSLALVSPAIAAFVHAPHIALPLALMSFVLALYGLYAPLVGVLNGRKRFGSQASLDMTFASLRTIGMLGLGYTFAKRGLGVLGAVLGMVTASAIILALATFTVRRTPASSGASEEEPRAPGEARAYLKGFTTLALAQLGTNLLLQVDVTFLGRALSLSGPAKSADEWVGVYRACENFAFLPYQLLFSITQILFPMVAKAHASGDTAQIRAYVARGSRLGALVCGLFVSVIAGLPEGVLRLLYTGEVAMRGAATLRILAIAFGGFAMLGIGNTVLASLGQEKTASRITLTSVAVLAGALFFIPSRVLFGETQLQVTACLSGCILAAALAVCARKLIVSAGTFVPLATTARVLFAAGAVIGVGGFLPKGGRILTLAECTGMALLFVAFLIGSRELGAQDVQAIRSLARRS